MKQNKFFIVFSCLTVFLGLLCLSSPMAQATKHNGQEPISLNPQDVERFSQVIAQVKHLYVDKVKDSKLFSEAIRGMLVGLDPHSSYLDEATYKELKNHARGNFVGLGVEVIQEKGIIKVISPIDDTPAAKAGIEAGDYILAVDGKPLIEKPINEAIQMMRGKKGTKVTLSVINERDKKPRKINIKRDVINIVSIKSKVLNKHYGYIRISHFQRQTGKKLIKAIKNLQKQTHHKLYGVILDVRNNPGGILESSAEVADLFLNSKTLKKNKLIVYAKGRTKSSNVSIKASGKDILSNAPLIVLINQGSASASEIVAGALQDHHRAIIMGQHSFGKGSVQTVLPIDSTTAIKLTTALYYTPKGRSIQAEGIEPDIIIDNLKIQKPEKNSLFLFNIREKDLKGHLENGNTLLDSQKQKAKMSELAAKDYQLFEALKLLQSMHIVQEGKDV